MCQIFVCLTTDLAELESQLSGTPHARMKMIITDGVFSMDGAITPLKSAILITNYHAIYWMYVYTREICDLADKYNALVFVDECHATGFLGATGR